jgi:hypothetical protein
MPSPLRIADLKRSPKGARTTININVPAHIIEAIDQLAKKLGASKTSVVRCWRSIAGFMDDDSASDPKPYLNLPRWAHWLCPLGSPAESLQSSAIVYAKKWLTRFRPQFRCDDLVYDDELWRYIGRDARFLRDQIEIVDPRLIVVAGPWTKLSQIGFFHLDEIILDDLNYGGGLFREGERCVLAYRKPPGALDDHVKHDLELVRDVMIANAGPEERRTLVGRRTEGLHSYCADCGIQVHLNDEVCRECESTDDGQSLTMVS